MRTFREIVGVARLFESVHAQETTQDARCATQKSKVGMSLVEVMLAMLILVVLVAVIPKAVQYPRSLVVQAAWQQTAIEAANEILEDAISRGFLELPLASDEYANWKADLESRYTMNGRSPVIERVVGEATGDPLIKRVQAIVTPPDSDQPVILETLVTEE